MNNPTPIKKWVSHKLDSKVERALQRLAMSRDVSTVAVMPDVHLAGDVCNGVVVATQELIYPQCVGNDIGCGYLSADLEVADRDSMSNLAELWNGIRQSVPINKHRDRPGFETEIELSDLILQKSALRDGRLQLGTLGRGNHFVELQQDERGGLSLLIHSGSRSMGQSISAWHLRNAEVDQRSGLKFLAAESESGKAFLNDMVWARKYAVANRLEMLGAIEEQVLAPMGIEIDCDSMLHLDHNHVQQEVHDGNSLWVHRKGAQGLIQNQVSVIPGSMGSTTFVVEGRGHVESMGSCSHGAGRSMSRKEAAKRISVRMLRRETEGVVLDQRRMKTLIDEAPSAYKDIRKVMKAQKDLVRIVGRREPVLNFKGR